jgi:PAS domain S-box-containing protein
MEQTRHSAEFLASLVDSSDDAIITKTVDGVVTSCNPAAERMYGYTCDELVGQPVAMIIPEEEMPGEKMILERISAGLKVENYETQRVRKDGTKIAVSLTVSPIKDEDGQVLGASSIGRDITERLRIAELQKHLEDLRRRRDQALQLNDAVVQGLAVVKMALEVGNQSQAMAALEQTLEAARSYVGDLMSEDSDGSERNFVRDHPVFRSEDPEET